MKRENGTFRLLQAVKISSYDIAEIEEAYKAELFLYKPWRPKGFVKSS